MLSPVLLIGVAAANPWGERQVLDVQVPDGAVATAGRWARSNRIVLGDAQGLTIVDVGDGSVVTVPIPVDDVLLADLDGNGADELLACGPTGVDVVKQTDTGIDTRRLTDVACLQLGWSTLGQGTLVIRTSEGVSRLTPGPGGLELAPFAGIPTVDDIAVVGPAIAALGDQLYVIGSPDAGEKAPADGTVAMIPDGAGFAALIAGEHPRVVRADGTEIPLPHAPVGGIDGLVNGHPAVILDGPAFVELADPGIVHDLPDGRLIATAELTGDDCSDLVLGPQLAIVPGVCQAPLAVPAAPVESAVASDTSGSVAMPREHQVTRQLEVGDTWPVVEVAAPGTIELRLVDAVGGATSFALSSGPSGLTLTQDGVLSFSPGIGDAGLWRVAFTVGDRHTGLIVRVAHPREPDQLEVLPVAETIDPRYRNNAARNRTEYGFFGMRGCTFGLGGGGGISKNNQSTWSNVGLPDWIPSGSPAVMFACTGGSEHVRWTFGVDSAPTYYYLAPGGRMNHILASTVGIELHTPAFRFAPIATAGLMVFGVGIKAQVLPFATKKGHRHGLELRALTYPATLSANGILAYTFEIGDF